MKVGNLTTFDSVYSLLQEGVTDVKTIGIFPGGFKPPHKGHFLTARSACEACDIVYILMSDKSRPICKPSSETNVPEWQKFESLLPGGKANEKLERSRVSLAEVDRTTSASAMRAKIDILNQTLGDGGGWCDIDTFEKNIAEFLPDIDPKAKSAIAETLTSERVIAGFITVEESQQIWEIYLSHLRQEFEKKEIILEVTAGSPVLRTYTLVAELDSSPNNILLYTGT